MSTARNKHSRNTQKPTNKRTRTKRKQQQAVAAPRKTSAINMSNQTGKTLNQLHPGNILAMAIKVGSKLGQDGFGNHFSNTGIDSPLMAGGRFVRSNHTNEELTITYRENWAVRRIIDTPAEDMTREWYSLATALPENAMDDIYRLEAQHSVQQEITNAMTAREVRQMYFNQPVLIPEAPGKLVFRKKGESTYVLLETGRDYDPNRKYTRVNRKIIGVQIPGRPELMLPNENYLEIVSKEEKTMQEEEKGFLETYQEEREHNFMLRDFFDQLFFEFQIMSRKRPNDVVNENKVKRINKVLEPAMEMMKDKPYAGFLELIPEPEEQETEDGKTILTGMSYSDVALLLTQFKSALNRYFQKVI